MKELLKKAISNDIQITIRYFGGSRPGACRTIKPNKIVNDIVYAYDSEADAIKTFSINKMEEYIEGEESKIAIKFHNDNYDFGSLQEALDFFNDTWVSLGWNPQLAEDRLSLYSKFKNGNLKKTPDIEIVFEEFDITYQAKNNNISNEKEYDYFPQILDISECDVVKVKKVKPWSVSAKTKNSIPYGSLNTAIKRFLEYSTTLAPKI